MMIYFCAVINSMLKSGQKLYSILFNKCPRCHKGKFWPHKPYYNLLCNGGKLYESCPRCGLKYYLEIGFWYGAMYVAYGLSTGIFLTGWAITAFAFPDEWSPWWQVGTICGAIILLMPVTYSLSRLIWINFFVKYEPDKKEESVLSEPKMSENT